MGRDAGRRRRRGPCRGRSDRRLRYRHRRRCRATERAVAASRSDSLTRSSLSPRITVVPSAKAAATASTGYSSIIDGARAGRHLDAAQAAGAHAQIGDLLAAFVASLEPLDRAPISAERREQPGAQRIHHHAVEDDVGAGHDQRRDQRKCRRRRIGRDTMTGCGVKFRLAGERDAPAMLALAARPAPRRRNARAFSRCGRASPRLRSRRFRPARQGRRAAPRISAAPTAPAARTRSASDRARPASVSGKRPLGRGRRRARRSAPADRACGASAVCAARHRRRTSP